MIFYVKPGFLSRRKKCKLCGKESILISEIIGVCVDCLRNNPEEALKIALEGHRKSRGKFNLPPTPPRDPNGLVCTGCANMCKIGEGGYGFCGLVLNKNGKLIRLAGTPDKAIVEWYYDNLPTNCVAEPFCPGCTGRGFPKYAYTKGPEYGFYNLAVFYGACNLDCLFCQNWHYRLRTQAKGPMLSAEELAKAAYLNRKVSCICYFGGDPSPQMMHAIKASEIALERKRQRILRICWETNGLMNKTYLKRAVELSLESGGCIKFDFKAWTPSIYKALTGCDNKPLIENLKIAADYIPERREPPLVVVSVLLVPGYVDKVEIEGIVEYIASLDKSIPISFLAFHPDYLMSDLPFTSKRHADEAVKIAKEYGLKEVSVGNVWLLGNYY